MSTAAFKTKDTTKPHITNPQEQISFVAPSAASEAVLTQIEVQTRFVGCERFLSFQFFIRYANHYSHGLDRFFVIDTLRKNQTLTANLEITFFRINHAKDLIACHYACLSWWSMCCSNNSSLAERSQCLFARSHFGVAHLRRIY